MSWGRVQVDETTDGSAFGARISAGASRTEVLGPYGDRVRIAVDAPARGGRANEALLRHLAALLKVPRDRVEISSGAGSPDKRIRVRGRGPGTVLAALRAAVRGG